MKTLRLESNELSIAATSILKGEVVGFPTETVYGLGVVYDNEEAFKKLMYVKNRPEGKKFTLMCSSYEMINDYAYLSDKTKLLINKYMPGPITIIVPSKKKLPKYVVDDDFVGVRISELKLVRDLIDLVNKPLLVPSANKSGEKPLSLYEDVYNVFNGEVKAIIKEDAKGTLPSTIIKIENDNLILLREGALKFEDILNFWRNL